MRGPPDVEGLEVLSWCENRRKTGQPASDREQASGEALDPDKDVGGFARVKRRPRPVDLQRWISMLPITYTSLRSKEILAGANAVEDPTGKTVRRPPAGR
jgi:hypothetical protein